VRTNAGTISVAVRVTRDAVGRLVFEVAPEDERSAEPTPADDRREENAALRILARQMAALADSRQLLTVLCEAAWAQCGACGAAVVEVDGDAARIAAAVGALQGVEGRRFMLAGSLTGRAIDSRGPVVTDDFGDSDSPLAAEMRQAEVGPALLEPLLAHDEVLGVLIVARQLGGSRFGQREVQRLQVSHPPACPPFAAEPAGRERQPRQGPPDAPVEVGDALDRLVEQVPQPRMQVRALSAGVAVGSLQRRLAIGAQPRPFRGLKVLGPRIAPMRIASDHLRRSRRAPDVRHGPRP
jgi:hypothetical protein